MGPPIERRCQVSVEMGPPIEQRCQVSNPLIKRNPQKFINFRPAEVCEIMCETVRGMPCCTCTWGCHLQGVTMIPSTKIEKNTHDARDAQDKTQSIRCICYNIVIHIFTWNPNGAPCFDWSLGLVLGGSDLQK